MYLAKGKDAISPSHSWYLFNEWSMKFYSSKGAIMRLAPVSGSSLDSSEFCEFVQHTKHGISEPVFYGDLVYKFKRIDGKHNFSDRFKKNQTLYKVEYNMDIMWQSSCLVVNPITSFFHILFLQEYWVLARSRTPLA